MTIKLQAAQRALKSKLKEVQLRPQRRDAIVVHQMADPADMIQEASDQETATWSLDHQALLAQQIRSAMDRIAEGTYGVCLSCEEQISPKRLQAIPWAELCIHCQENADAIAAHQGMRVAVGQWLEAA